MPDTDTHKYYVVLTNGKRKHFTSYVKALVYFHSKEKAVSLIHE